MWATDRGGTSTPTAAAHRHRSQRAAVPPVTAGRLRPIRRYALNFLNTAAVPGVLAAVTVVEPLRNRRLPSGGGDSDPFEPSIEMARPGLQLPTSTFNLCPTVTPPQSASVKAGAAPWPPAWLPPAPGESESPHPTTLGGCAGDGTGCETGYCCCYCCCCGAPCCRGARAQASSYDTIVENGSHRGVN